MKQKIYVRPAIQGTENIYKNWYIKIFCKIFIFNRGELICLTCKKLLCYKCAFIGGHKDHVCKEIIPAKDSLLKRIDQITGMNARKAQKLVDVGNGLLIFRISFCYHLEYRDINSQIVIFLSWINKRAIYFYK